MKPGQLENQEVKIVDDDPDFGDLIINMYWIGNNYYFNVKAYNELFSRYDELIHFAVKLIHMAGFFVSKYIANTVDEDVAIGISDLYNDLKKAVENTIKDRDKFTLKATENGCAWKELGFSKPSDITKSSIMLESVIGSIAKTSGEIISLVDELKKTVSGAPLLDKSINSTMVHVQVAEICDTVVEIVNELENGSAMRLARAQLAIMYYDGIVAKRMMKIKKEKK